MGPNGTCGGESLLIPSSQLTNSLSTNLSPCQLSILVITRHSSLIRIRMLRFTLEPLHFITANPASKVSKPLPTPMAPSISSDQTRTPSGCSRVAIVRSCSPSQQNDSCRPLTTSSEITSNTYHRTVREALFTFVRCCLDPVLESEYNHPMNTHSFVYVFLLEIIIREASHNP